MSNSSSPVRRSRAKARLLLAASFAVALALVAVLPTWAGDNAVPAPGPDGGPTVESLGWMAGCWMTSRGDKSTEEMWTKPAGGTILGVGRRIAGGKTTFHEFLMIERRDDGALYYVATVPGQGPVGFKLVSHGEGEAVFENPGHDFPQRLVYRMTAEGGLYVRVEGMGEGARGFDYTFARQACD